jgi:hypothetical protein
MASVGLKQRLFKSKSSTIVIAVLIIAIIAYIILNYGERITGAMVATSGFQEVKALQSPSCGDGYCDSTESYDVCKIDCPYSVLSH